MCYNLYNIKELFNAYDRNFKLGKFLNIPIRRN